MEVVRSRRNHSYTTERVTPKGEIPPQSQIAAILPKNKGFQIVDSRLCYNFDGERYVECGSVWSHAEEHGFSSPE